MIPDVVVPQEVWKSDALKEAAKYLNLVAILATVHRRPEAIRFLQLVGSNLTHLEIPDSSHPGPRSSTEGGRGKRVSRMGRSGNVA